MDEALPHRLEWPRRSELRAALREHPLVHIPAPRLTEAELLALAEGVGTAEPSRRLNFRLPGAPAIMRIGNVRNESGERVAGSALRQGFHSDQSYREAPPAITMLYALEVPERGGDTQFSSLYRLYDELDDETRAAWASLEVEHESSVTYFKDAPDRRSVHPLVLCHPDSGRHLVFASPGYTRRVIGVPEDESVAILQRIADALEALDVAHRWQPHDLLVWDNRAVVHRATEYDLREARCLWRISVRLNP